MVGAGGQPEPLWETRRPQWFPQEFDWAVGCSYMGMPESATVVRNVWSNTMAIRRQAFDAVGVSVMTSGRLVPRPALKIPTCACGRQNAKVGEPGSMSRMQSSATESRRNAPPLSHFFRRCYYEGQGKATLASLNGISESISTERLYTRYVLPYGIVRRLRETACGDASGAARSFAIIAGKSFAIVGFADRAVRYVVARQGAGRLGAASVTRRRPVSRH